MMTYERLLDGGTFRVWCLSTDDKPLAEDGMTNGSQAYEMDTGATYYYNADEDAWIKAGKKAPVSLAITGTMTAEAYEGDAPDITGLTVTATYTDASTADVTESAEIISPAIYAEGENKLRIAYTDNGVRVIVEKSVTATALALSSIAITTPPTKTAYAEGETFDPEGMVVTATLNSGATLELEAGEYTWAPTEALTVEDEAITVTAEWREVTKTATQAITVTGEENDA